MKASLTACLLFAGLMVSCSKQPVFRVDTSWETGSAVVFSVSGLDTKADAVVNLPSFGVSCFMGELGRKAQLQWRSVYMDEGEGVYVAETHDRYWPQVGDPGYKFVASNAELTLSSSSIRIDADGSTDVVVAVNQTPSPRSSNTLDFHHIYARIGKVTVSEVGMHPLTEVSITLVPRIGGIYDVMAGDGHSDGTGWGSFKYGSETEISSGNAGVKDNDLLIVPGSYVLTARWSVRKPNRIASFEKTREVVFEAGTNSNILTSFGSDGEDLTLSVSLRDWNSTDQEATFVEEEEEE